MKPTCLHCDRASAARGLCMMHYKRARNDGTLDGYGKQAAITAHNRLDLSGQRFGKWLVLELDGIKAYASGSKTTWRCVCDCGNTAVVLGSSLVKRNGSRSCGCESTRLTVERSKKHGMAGTRAYRIWQAMRNRCRNKNVNNYENYGGRGIQVCERWESFENFISDMGDPPEDCSIDRINNDGDYTPENCRWASRVEQARNRSTNRRITLNGETRLLAEWAEGLGIDQSSLRERLERWPIEAALTTPKKA